MRSHRALLVVSTVGLGVVGSRIAEELGSPGWWLLGLGCALILWLSDVFRGLDTISSDLARGGRVPYAQAAADVVKPERRRILFVMIVALLVVICGVLLLLATVQGATSVA